MLLPQPRDCNLCHRRPEQSEKDRLPQRELSGDDPVAPLEGQLPAPLQQRVGQNDEIDGETDKTRDCLLEVSAKGPLKGMGYVECALRIASHMHLLELRRCVFILRIK